MPAWRQVQQYLFNTCPDSSRQARFEKHFRHERKRLTMQRRPNTDVEGKAFSDEIVEAVWQKARTMGTSAILRVDAWGWTIVRQDYGSARSRYGWEIDHIVPVNQGG